MIVAILVIGPKDFPVVLKKIGNWIGTTKRYFSDIQNKVQNLDQDFDENSDIFDTFRGFVMCCPSERWRWRTQCAALVHVREIFETNTSNGGEDEQPP